VEKAHKRRNPWKSQREKVSSIVLYQVTHISSDMNKKWCKINTSQLGQKRKEGLMLPLVRATRTTTYRDILLCEYPVCIYIILPIYKVFIIIICMLKYGVFYGRNSSQGGKGVCVCVWRK